MRLSIVKSFDKMISTEEIMTVIELLPRLKALNHKDKIRAIQFLANEVAKEEDVLFNDGATYEIWSPFDSFEAAEQLNSLLEKEKTNA